MEDAHAGLQCDTHSVHFQTIRFHAYWVHCDMRCAINGTGCFIIHCWACHHLILLWVCLSERPYMCTHDWLREFHVTGWGLIAKQFAVLPRSVICRIQPILPGTQAAIQETMFPPAGAFPSLTFNASMSIPPEEPPEVPKGICNSDLAMATTQDRLIAMISFMVEENFYVNLDFHSFGADEGFLVEPADVEPLVNAWADLVANILAAVPEIQGRLMLDLLNEPDGCGPGLPILYHL